MRLGRVGIFLITPILVTIATYAVFDRYLTRTSHELLSSWLKNEQISIQEGQLLVAITKNKRSLNSSDFVRGMWIIDDSAGGLPRVLADFGQMVSLPKAALPKKAGEIEIRHAGLFHRIALYRFPERDDLTIAFNIEPDFARQLFVTNILAIIALLMVFFIAIGRQEKREANERLELIKSALNALAGGGPPSPELLSQVPQLVGVWQGMQAELKRSVERERISFSRVKLGSFAKKASHDLKSPFTALDVAIKSILSLLSEEKRIEIRSSLSGLRDLIYSLYEKSRAVDLTIDVTEIAAAMEADAPGEPTLQLLPTLVEQQLSISRLQYRSRREVSISAELGPESYGIFARVNLGEFRRVLANLITNAVEAIEQTGSVTVTLTREATDVILRVADTGKGIAAGRLATIGELGVTDKPEGSGSGVHFSKSVVAAWGGTLEISSELGRGTTIEIRLPEVQPPTWFVPELNIPSGGTVVVLDDDPAIHGIWKTRIEALAAQGQPISFLSFTSVGQMISGLSLGAEGDPRACQRLYLCDYELGGDSETGLDAIERLGLASQAILVTSHSDDPNVTDRCQRLGCLLLPKSAAGLVPIKLGAQLHRPDYVLIDNDALVHQTWSLAAKQHGKALMKFFSVDEFLVVSDDFDRTTPIYVDSDLGDGIKGEEMARYIHSSGFQSIYLQTGSSLKSFTAPMPWIKAIVGKTPPWMVVA